MIYTREQAVKIMNNLGTRRVPFLFIIDFGMKAIRIFHADAIPSNVSFTFPGSSKLTVPEKFEKQYYFKKYPVSRSQYEKAFIEVKNQISGGNTFLLNLTFPTQIETNLTLPDIYKYSQAKYKLLLNNEFVCFSPETFVTISDRIIASYPMKGTIKASGPEARKKILNNPKELAEHHTIVDLIRNDLSMVAKDVTVRNFRYIETLKTNEGDILQVSSEIVGQLPENYNQNLGNIVFTLLPAGSVTGAPKAKTIAIIESAEQEKRGYYTGVCGYFDGSKLDSAVMIRFIECHNNTLRFRSGGGITCNSDMESEYCELKDKVYVPIV
jgi:para-aminobenzoate synthetase component I